MLDLQSPVLDVSSNAADKLSDDGQEQLARVGWGGNAADAVTVLVDHVGDALADVQTDEFVADDFQQRSSTPSNSIVLAILKIVFFLI